MQKKKRVAQSLSSTDNWEITKTFFGTTAQSCTVVSKKDFSIVIETKLFDTSKNEFFYNYQLNFYFIAQAVLCDYYSD